MKIRTLLQVAAAAFFFACPALAQNAGTVTAHAFAIGKGAGQTGYTSLLCGSAQLAVGQSAADPICKTITGDVTISAAGVTAIGTAKVTAAMMASMTSAQLAGIISDETGSGAVVFATSPTLVTPTADAYTGTAVGGGGTSAFVVKSTIPSVGWWNTSGGANSKIWDAYADPAGWNLRLVNDTSGSAVNAIGVTRSGMTVTGVSVPNSVLWVGTSGSVGGTLVLAGSASGTVTLVSPSAAGSGTLTLPAATDTLIGKATTDTLTNKTIDTAGPNTIKINGNTLSATAGTATVTVPNATDTLVGRATTDALTNKTISGASNTLSNVGLSSLSTQAAYTLNGNFTGSAASPTASTIGALTQKVSPAATDLIILQDQAASGALKYATVSSISSAGSVASIDAKTGSFTTGNGLDSTAGNVIELTAARRTLPTTQVFTTGSGTYTTPANVLWIEVQVQGGGGGGGGGGSSPGAATAGSVSTFGTTLLTANGGAFGGGGTNIGGAGGAASGGFENFTGSTGGTGGASISGSLQGTGGAGGISSCYAGAGSAGYNGAGGAAIANTGSGGGGGGAGSGATVGSGGGGGAGGCVRAIITSPASSYSYAVGSGGSGGTAGTNGFAGGNGAAGIIRVIEHYGS